MRTKIVLARWAVAALALYGVMAAFSISQLHMSGVQACPSLGSMPACYVVLLGYGAMLLSAVRPMPWVFFAGWLPVFLLAALGVGSEILSTEAVCPQTAGGIPKCYFSFALSVLLGLLAWVFLRAIKR